MMQTQRMAEMQMRVSQMQMDMMRTMERVQLNNIAQAPLPGMLARSLGGFSGPAYAGRMAAPVPSQSFGGLLADAGLGRALSNLTGGFLFPGYSMQFGASRALVTQRAEDELRQRIDDFAIRAGSNALNMATFGVSDFFINRSSLAFLTERGTTARNIMNRFANVRSGLRPEDMAAGGRGARLYGDFTQNLTTDFQRAMTDLNRMRGFSLSKEDYGNLEDAIFSSMTFGERERLVRSGRGAAAQQIEQRRNEIVELTKALSINTTQAAELARNISELNVSTKDTVRVARQVNVGTMNLGITRDQETEMRLGLITQGRGMDLGTGRAFSSAQFASSALLFNRLTSQGREEELGRFGGSGMTAAQNYQNQMFQIGANMQQRTGVAVGLGGFMGEQGTVGLAQTMARVYGRNPLAALTLQLDPNARVRSAVLSPLAAYRQIMADAQRFGPNSLLSRPELLAQRFANLTGVSIERGAEMMETYRRSDQQFNTLAGQLSSLGNQRVTSADLTNFQQRAAAAGVALSAEDINKYDKSALLELLKSKTELTQSQYFDIATMSGGVAPPALLDRMDPKDRSKGLMVFQGLDLSQSTYSSFTAPDEGVAYVKRTLGKDKQTIYTISDPIGTRKKNIESLNKRLATDARFAGITGEDIVKNARRDLTVVGASNILSSIYEKGDMGTDLFKRRISALSAVFEDSKEAAQAKEDLIRRLSKISATSGSSFNLDAMRQLVEGKGEFRAGFDTPLERQQAANELNQFGAKAMANSAPEKVLINEFGEEARRQLAEAFGANK
jgi:hypothetical protein